MYRNNIGSYLTLTVLTADPVTCIIILMVPGTKSNLISTCEDRSSLCGVS